MSIAFDKRDYHYYGDDLEEEVVLTAEEDDALEEEIQENFFRSTAVPSEWVLCLFEELNDISKFHAVEILDKLDPVTFAKFVNIYSRRAFDK